MTADDRPSSLFRAISLAAERRADIHNFLARLALDSGDRAAARREAEIARDRAWCDGPPRCYRPALDAAERLLGEIGQAAQK